MPEDLNYESVSNQGERVLLEDRQLIRSHLQRYKFALQYVRPDSHVLDCACGSGYGSYLLSSSVAQVTGIDLSPVAIHYCRETFKAPNLKFTEGSAEALQVPSNSIDLFCSIETIEHIPNPDRLVKEAKRVLKPGGRFLVSTPNRVNSGLVSGERPANPFHLVEWSLKEFDKLLRQEFQRISYFGQRIRSKNKFHKMYVVSKLKRALGQIDLTPMSVKESLLDSMETLNCWQPENFIAVCER